MRLDPLRRCLAPAAADGRVYLTPAAAAMPWKHPVFSGTSRDRAAMPDIRLDAYQASWDRARRRAAVRGRLISTRPAHSVVILDNPERAQGSYWARGYAARLEADGSFEVPITEPMPVKGQLDLLFCFDNGIVTGDGRGHGDASAIVKPYRFERGALVFDP